jgi:FtsP/CotA-like multicopper oxidase with cupredoxin domain
MAHPMHPHGHHFQVLGLNGKQMQGAMRDTVLVPVNGLVRTAFDAGRFCTVTTSPGTLGGRLRRKAG